MMRLASVKGRALPKILSEVGAEEEEVPPTKGKRKAMSLASEGSNKKKSMIEEEDLGSKGPAKWVKLEEDFNTDADSIVGRWSSQVIVNRKKGTVTRGFATYSIQKLQAKLGANICLPVAVGTSRIPQLNCVYCPKKGAEGHEILGECHSFPAGWHANFNSDTKRTVVQAEYLHQDFQ